ncbi:hypothetical protein Q673_13150 [Marinobacter sp. EN3]|jgi:Na+-translocating ferredoxin:NAD+ oxidoreductase RnfE subunit|nr:hypothetical protein Q673_13150 [Marinobacter sp. EN3]
MFAHGLGFMAALVVLALADELIGKAFLAEVANRYF